MDIVDVARAGASARWRAVSATTVVVVGLTAVSAQRYGRARPGRGQVSQRSNPSSSSPGARARLPRRRRRATPRSERRQCAGARRACRRGARAPAPRGTGGGRPRPPRRPRWRPSRRPRASAHGRAAIQPLELHKHPRNRIAAQQLAWTLPRRQLSLLRASTAPRRNQATHRWPRPLPTAFGSDGLAKLRRAHERARAHAHAKKTGATISGVDEGCAGGTDDEVALIAARHARLAISSSSSSWK